MSMADIHEGGCLCGAVRYRTRGPALGTLVCHCRFCQRMTGTIAWASSTFDTSAVETTGLLRTHAHRSETSGMLVRVHFCPGCSTVVMLTFERWPESTAISRGSFDDPDWVEIEAHIWTASARSGVMLPAGTDCYRHGRTRLDGTRIKAIRHAQPVPANKAASGQDE